MKFKINDKVVAKEGNLINLFESPLVLDKTPFRGLIKKVFENNGNPLYLVESYDHRFQIAYPESELALDEDLI